MSTTHEQTVAHGSVLAGALGWLFDCLARAGWATLPDSAEWYRPGARRPG